MNAHASLNWGQSSLTLLPERAAWDPQRRALLVADLHLGKAESFQAQGIPLPSDGDREPQSSSRALLQPCPEQVLVLGDLIHSRLANGRTEKLAALPDLMGHRFGERQP